MNDHPFANPARRFHRLPACKPLVAAIALALAAPHAVFAVPPVTALPTGETLGANTVAQIARTGGSAPTMVINQTSRNAIIDWSTFSIGSQASVSFNQPTGGVALNRVGGSANPSEIYGALNATGSVFLVNPSGIIFGPGAAVNVGSLVASTLGMTDDAFASGNNTGRYLFSGAPAGVGVANEGRLTAATAGTIALLGATVSNTGTITGRLGRVALAAGDQVTVDFSGDGLTRLTVSGGDLAALVSNGGAVINDGGEVTMTAASAEQLAQVLIGTGSTVQARSLTTRNGRIFLDAGTAGEVDVAGTLDVAGATAGRTGGAVQIQAGTIHLDPGASIDARGDAGGGTVNVLASDATANPDAPTLAMAPTATITTDATGAGTGGSVDMLAAESAALYGTVSARGGAAGGNGSNGGTIRTMATTLDLTGFRADASATNGAAGQWTIWTNPAVLDDPLVTSIEQALNSNTNTVLNTYTDAFTPSPTSLVVNQDIVKTTGGTASLTLNAGGTLTVAQGFTVGAASTGGRVNVTLNGHPVGSATTAVALGAGAAIVTHGGTIGLAGDMGQVTVGGLLDASATGAGLRGGAVGLTGSGVVLTSGRIDTRGDGGGGAVSIAADTLSVQDNATIVTDAITRGTGGNVSLQASEQAAVDGTVTARGGVSGGNGAAIRLIGASGASTLSGRLDASASGAGGLGGTVTVRGTIVTLADGSSIDARGNAGGGTVDVFASDATASPAAPSLTMASGAIIAADATATGTGGRVDMLAAESAALDGTVTARGGGAGGNGGTIRTMATTLALNAFLADASAANGTAGQWTIWTNSAVLDDPLVASIEGALNTNTNTVLTTYTDAFTPLPTSLTVNQDIRKTTAGAASLTMNAGGNIVVAEGVTIGASGAGQLGVTLNASANATPSANGGGAVVLEDRAAILTNGGALNLYGGNAALVSSSNETTYAQGVSLTNATLDSRAAQSSAGGNITIVGQGAMTELPGRVNRVGIAVNNTVISSGSGAISLTGTGGLTPATVSSNRLAGDGIHIVSSDTTKTISSNAGSITLTGVEGGNGATGDVEGGIGVLLSLANMNGSQVFSANGGDIAITGTAYAVTGIGTYVEGGLYANGAIKLTGLGLGAASTGLRTGNLILSAPTGGSVSLIGRSDSGVGVNLFNTRITTAPGADGQGNVVVAGESAVATNGLMLNGLRIGSEAMSGNVSISALNRPAGADAPSMITVATGLPDVSDTLTSITTTGVINFRPGGVSTTGALTDAYGVPITVGVAASNLFHIALADFHLGSDARVVIGSSGHAGAITYADTGRLNGSLTLQNDGAGSGGIAITTPLQTTGQVTLSSGGRVVGDAAITSTGLLLHGAQAASSFQLTNAGNAVGTLAAVFDTPRNTADATSGSVNVVNNGALTLGSLAGDSASRITAIGLVVSGNVLVRTTGPLTLAQNLSTTDGNITLVTGTVFDNAANNNLTASGGVWQVFANTWLGEARGGLAGVLPHPNLYNCAYGAGCSANVAGNRFVYVQQPTVTLRGDALSRIYGDANPALSYSATGLVNGDTVATALEGNYVTAATRASNVGSYAITGTFTSPEGYLIVAQPGSLAIDRAALTIAAADQSKVYGAADPLLTATYTGLKGDDTSAVITGLQLATTTGAAANAGTHPITASGASAANYAVQYVPGVLTVTPAVLTYVADPTTQFAGAPARPTAGTVTGFVYGDGLANATTGALTFTNPATLASAPGIYAVQGGGLASANYRFVQAPANTTALVVLANPVVDLPTIVKDVTFETSNVYTKNVGTPRVCVATGSFTGNNNSDSDDPLAMEWTRVRVSPNLSNCLSMGQRNSCQDF